jgi:hypothetical protein
MTKLISFHTQKWLNGQTFVARDFSFLFFLLPENDFLLFLSFFLGP